MKYLLLILLYLVASIIWFIHGLETGKKHRNYNDLSDYIFFPGCLFVILLIRPFLRK